MSLTVKEKAADTPQLPAREPGRTPAKRSPAARRLPRLLRAAVWLALLAASAWGGTRFLNSNAGRQWRLRAAALAGRQPEKPDFVPTTRVARGTLDISLTLVGTLKAEESVPVAAETSGTIVWIADDGTPVKKGDVVVQLQNDQLKLQIDERKVAYVNALSRLEDTKRDRKLEAENAQTQLAKGLEELSILKESNKSAIDQATAALEFGRTDLAIATAQMGKNVRLAEEHLVTTRELDKSRQDVEAKKFAVAKAESQLDMQRAKLASDENQKQAEVNRLRFAADLAERRIGDEVKNAQKNVDTIKKQLDDLQDQLKKSIVRAPADGVVVLEQTWESGSRSLRAGDIASPRRKLMELPNLARMVVNCDIAEKDIGPVRRGEPVRITLDPYPGVVYHGTVKEVSAVAKPANIEGAWMQGKNSFATVIQVKESNPQRLRPGMNATAEILASTEKDVTYVPVDALFERQEKHLVYRMRVGRFYPTPVGIGARNKDYAVIKKGVKPGDTVALVFPPENMIVH